MFTGLIEKTGRVEFVTQRGGGRFISIDAGESFCADLKKGDSVSVDGCCLTCEDVKNGVFSVFALNESAEKTIIGSYRPGSSVNLEKAVKAGDRLGGHIVNGHVDGTGKILFFRKSANKANARISLDGRLAKYIVENDSISVNGVSLTVKSLYGSEFTLDIIPETLKTTGLDGLRSGDMVNIEINHMTKSLYEFTRGR